MDLVSKSYGFQSLPPMTSPVSSSIFGPRSHSSDTSFPIIAIAIIGILATAFLLLSYYIFVIKCCLNWHRIDLLRRFSLSRNRNHEDPLMAYSPAAIVSRGLDESVIRSIPVFKFKKEGNNFGNLGERSFCECAVCLNEFQEAEKLRNLPNCNHDSIHDCIIAPSSSPQDPNPYSESLIVGDEDYVVIEISNHNSTDQTLLAAQERLNSGELSARSISPSPKTIEQRAAHKKSRKFNKVTSMGDECIDTRGKDDQFGLIQPIRRSFSMDSSADWQLYLCSSRDSAAEQASNRGQSG
uniref:RING-type E3 ubiquitin transferase n=1 Tax=Salix viminalis TaxID=40686 RepID=A0A6N2MR68_SALVM